MSTARALDVAKSTVLLFAAAIVQVSIFSGIGLLGGSPDVLLVTLVCVALFRGSINGALAGFAAGLVVDTANLGTLGMTSLLLTLLGYWIGRYGETTGRDRLHAPFVSIAIATALYALGTLALHFLLGEPAPAKRVLVEGLFPAILLNLVLTVPIYALVRRAVRSEPARLERAQDVRLLG